MTSLRLVEQPTMSRSESPSMSAVTARVAPCGAEEVDDVEGGALARALVLEEDELVLRGDEHLVESVAVMSAAESVAGRTKERSTFSRSRKETSSSACEERCSR